MNSEGFSFDCEGTPRGLRVLVSQSRILTSAQKLLCVCAGLRGFAPGETPAGRGI